MKAVVLAGGYATRLWPITKHRPKMFLPVGDQTVIDTIFEDLEADDRVSEVFVSTNERFADSFEEYIADSSFEKPTLSVEDTSAEDEKFGVVGALEQLIDREEVDEDLVVIAGDNLISFDVADFVDFFYEKDEPCLAAYDVQDRERAKSYGLVELDGDRVVNFQEKPDDPKSTLVSIACYAFPAEDLPKFDEYLAGDNNPDEPGWFMQWLQQNGDVFAYTFDGAWFDIGTPQSYLDAVAWYLDGENYIHDTATLNNTELGTNVHVMADAVVEDSTLDESVVFPGAIVRNAELKNSIVDEETHIENLDLSNALIGAHSKLTNGQ
ncbi:NDP-sugar synthase [Haloferax mediterranei ATCC 33500]|uniref:Glucose-1-phosphate thymidylyltransferase n=1 Tax=Haloferax mediterranei (strain ATCC 33500 / DSM 1411 / JCM 8866 / NBRC 14739 / NCIMB 2177 / R-4) TaxID=523841 RepID=I3R3I7_HALMT|nr:NDP-sugar synthase [Haloferax mediterranei]AFK18797.1 sugar nucleotidyltransferase (glucose-1-phosphate thymidylyltransferase) [Haloferax mediterranei ATCC 33500]AHZ21835.1 glucose-1-phosphate thymidylyltransferase [Haloferax mediterranei ATCC 33500]EMA03344.1 sugar nucleotidyltransferase (glucose-1-phosphate thymidylyltransferase) [Haloferax mediterranei ATCC 33500]MDX5988892.1 NDP-sugar synthase [Haloferax mediterranei ATCC 33500]QCQ75289.1 NDP-sugar synthase [Haloferax mediterranei ATCC 